MFTTLEFLVVAVYTLLKINKIISVLVLLTKLQPEPSAYNT